MSKYDEQAFPRVVMLVQEIIKIIQNDMSELIEKDMFDGDLHNFIRFIMTVLTSLCVEYITNLSIEAGNPPPELAKRLVRDLNEHLSSVIEISVNKRIGKLN